MPSASQPIRPDEIEGLFGFLAFALEGSCALAVSGGADSTAMMLLFADWLAQRGADSSRHWVLTVDHGLRPESGAEARAVANAAAALGFRHAILDWAGAKPATGIQAAARSARYRLMREHMRAHGVGLLLTAHTQDDQAETVLMRLARGSGVDGLSGMAPLSSMDTAVDDAAAPVTLHIARPLLDVPKARLIATLRARDQSWIEDPSNQAPAQERARLRARRQQRDELGLADAMLALSARRLSRSRRTLDLIAERFCDPSGGAVAVDPCGFFTVHRTRLQEAGEDIALRVLGRAIAAAGGSDEPVPLAGLEAVLEEFFAADPSTPRRWTLARAMVTATGTALTVEREPPRQPLPEATLAAGQKVLWDGRFQLAAGPDLAGGPIEIRALGDSGLAELRRRGAIATACPARAAALVPAFRRGDQIVAVPSLSYWAAPEDRAALEASFIGIGNSGPDARLPRGSDEPEAC
jgi:tRNA(Ile)-lysidine synthase